MEQIVENGISYNIARDKEGKIVHKAACQPWATLEKPLSKFQFRCLFTRPERVLIDNFASNSTLPMEGKAQLATYHADMDSLDSIDLTHPEVISGVNLLEQMGLLAKGRAQQILANKAPSVS